MAAISFARQSQSTARRPSRESASSSGTSRSTNGLNPNDPLQPLRAMADRVGKEVEKFAERVDHWHTHGNESAQAKYQTTVKMVGKFRDVAESQVKELKKANEAENKGDLAKSMRRRIQKMAEAPNSSQGGLGQSFQSLTPLIEDSSMPDSKKLQELRQWQAELATWELLRIIIDHYYPEPGTDPAAAKKERLAKAGAAARYGKNSEIWDHFLLEDDQAKEKALIRRWLEQTAQNSESDIQSITAELEAASGKDTHTWTSGWLDTKSKIKQAKRMEGTDQPLKPNTTNLKSSDRSATLVTQLDPDASIRQNRALEKSDEYYERALWMVCYEMMRRGVPWKHIVEWCQERNETWRGVSMGAAYEAHSTGGPNVAGPNVGFLFRRMCFYAARGARIPYEGAVYGLLSGDLRQVQAVSRSWDDHLYAHYNALLLSRFDTYLQKNYPQRVPESLSQKFAFQDAVANIGDWEESPQKVIALLKQQRATADQSVSPFKLIQGALISRTVDDLMLKVGVALADMLQTDARPQALVLHPDSSVADRGAKPVGEHRTFTAERWYQTLASDPHAFRILVHVFIVFQNGLLFNLGTEEEQKWVTIDNVVAAYVEFLRISKRIQLIPLYAAQLQPDRAAHCLARVLPDVKNGEEQRRCVALLEQYRIDITEVVAQNFTFAFRNSGFIHFDNDGFSVITNPIQRFKVVEQIMGTRGDVLWPGVRIKEDLDANTSDDKEQGIIEALQWYHYIGSDYRQTFDHLRNALTIFLLNGRLGAAERVVGDLSVESLSLSRTEALCGYPFDITQPGADEQDERQLHEHRDGLTGALRAAAIPLAQLPDADRHRQIVEYLRQKSSAYFDLQQIVRLIVAFRDWRNEEDTLIKLRSERSQDASAHKPKIDTQRTRQLLDTISTIFKALVDSLSETANRGQDEGLDAWNLKKAYMPDLVLAYLSVLQSASYFLQRDPAMQAMEVAVLVADDHNKWLQQVLLETGRMSELVDALACVSKAMLRLAEGGGEKKTEKKKRGSKGETLRVWELGGRERV